LAIEALLVDVDGVLVDGRPEDGLHWLTAVEADLGFTADALHEHFFAPHWDDIVVGRAALMDRLTPALRMIAPHVSPDAFCTYWFEKDSRLVAPLLAELASLRSTGARVFLATNQEHLRAAYLMDALGLADHVDGIFYSARLGAKKPEVEFFARVQAAVGLRADQMLLIDDSRANIDAALKEGWHALHWTKQSQPDIIRRSMTEASRSSRPTPSPRR
jgi:putative hydrolase of the HAD superfamily